MWDPLGSLRTVCDPVLLYPRPVSLSHTHTSYLSSCSTRIRRVTCGPKSRMMMATCTLSTRIRWRVYGGRVRWSCVQGSGGMFPDYYRVVAWRLPYTSSAASGYATGVTESRSLDTRILKKPLAPGDVTGNGLGATTFRQRDGSTIRSRRIGIIGASTAARLIRELDGSFRRVHQQHILLQHLDPGDTHAKRLPA